jgi:hypothetical protein
MSNLASRAAQRTFGVLSLVNDTQDGEDIDLRLWPAPSGSTPPWPC